MVSAGLRRLFRAPVYLYRWKCSWILGHRFLLLIHVGRRTRLHRCTILEVMEFRKGSCEMVVMSAFGPNADWFRNIEATPGAEVVIGSKRFAVTHRILDLEEAARVVASYEQRHWLLAPIIRVVLSRLLGWRYDGSEHARLQAVVELPLISFRPVR